MKVEIIDRPMNLKLTGVAGRHDPSKRYGEEIIALLDQIWGPFRAHQVPNKGINHVLYYADGEMFAGVEADVESPEAIGLVLRELSVPKYAYCMHKGPYSGLAQAYTAIKDELRRLGLKQGSPVIEIYGHWKDDEAELETEVIYPIEG